MKFFNAKSVHTWVVLCIDLLQSMYGEDEVDEVEGSTREPISSCDDKLQPNRKRRQVLTVKGANHYTAFPLTSY